MVFSSIVFLFRFLPFFFLFYFLFPRRGKNIVLFLGSLFFYAWGEPVYVLLMLFSTAVDYTHGRMLGYLQEKKAQKRTLEKLVLLSSVSINLLVLCFFKYADFLIETFHLPLPVGISFYTFQTMSYTIDVYNKKADVQKNLLDFGVYVTMFPQLIAGPIVKYRDVADRLGERAICLSDVSSGLKRFCIGLAKKVLAANNIGELWALISDMNIHEISMATAWLGVTAFALQIYFDFSGYSDMAIGLGKMLGFEFPENFNYPYISASVTEFWRRWHISLGSWFREYVYIPLGGSRKGRRRQLFHILIVWLATGIWHGAGWNFLLWGLWFAFALALEKLFLGKVLLLLPKAAGIFYTVFIVFVGWVLFALDTPAEILEYLRAMFGVSGRFVDTRAIYMCRQYMLLLFAAAIASTPLICVFAEKMKHSQARIGRGFYCLGEKIIPAVLFLLSVAGIVEGSYNPFLYFRF